ncbi:hypothetical protein [Novosphingobium sp. 9]|uniref:hypothetical protein n=1 Tax=Novosphingobium sp. 9 TaxID=2025349 RepID=UPI0021B4F2F7|nr:hypothetical protein [Novosphingobium sp. 9]
MSLLAFVAAVISPTLPVTALPVLPAAAGYGCVVHDNGTKAACPASPYRVAQGKGMTAPTRTHKAKTQAGPTPVCHPDPMKGRACRHHEAQREDATLEATAVAVR